MTYSVLHSIPSESEVASFRRRMLFWFKKHGRIFPWRQNHDPFKVLIAELMLRRTRAEQVEQVFQELFDRYPDARSLALGNSKDVESILHHLGLHWRTPSFQKVAGIIANNYSGTVPEEREELNRLPGVGAYVAGAVLSIAYNKREWIVDSNIVRVFKRYFGIDTSKEGRRDRHVIEISKMYVSTRNPRAANLAIIDFAAIICVPRSPKHQECPIKKECNFYKRIQLYP